MEFFDSNGHAVCYVTQTGRIYSWDGRPLATRKGDKVHTCDGEFVGWIRHGYLINEKGECCLFTQGADTKCGPYPRQTAASVTRNPATVSRIEGPPTSSVISWRVAGLGTQPVQEKLAPATCRSLLRVAPLLHEHRRTDMTY